LWLSIVTNAAGRVGGMNFVLACTRNLYGYVRVTIHSILKYNPDSTVYLFAEDDTVPGIDDERVKIIKAPEMDLGMNTENNWTVMAFVRLFIAKFLPIDKCLYLDVDTIVRKNLCDLYDLDIQDYDCAAVKETLKENYYNSGVLLMNLKRIRNAHDNDAIALLRKEKLMYPDQDAINRTWDIMQIGPTYNSCGFTVECDDPHIKHYPATPKGWNHRGTNWHWWMEMENEVNG